MAEKRSAKPLLSLDALGASYGEVQLALLVDAAPTGPGWRFELKFDGYRILALKSGSETRLLSRSQRDWTADFAPIAHAIAGLNARQLVLDGELCALKEDGSSSFQLLQNRSSSTTRLVYFVFDCLMLEGADLRPLPIEARRAALAELGSGWTRYGKLILSSAVESDPKEVLRLACDAGMEGIVAKAEGSPYVGGRTRTWLKIKCGRRQEFAIVGWLPLIKRESVVGSLVLGLKEPDGRFHFAGKVGTGFTDERRRSLFKLLRHDQSPSPTAEDVPRSAGAVRFVAPRYVAEVGFTEWTDDGSIRHPSFQVRISPRRGHPDRRHVDSGIAADVDSGIAGTWTRRSCPRRHPDRSPVDAWVAPCVTPLAEAT